MPIYVSRYRHQRLTMQYKLEALYLQCGRLMFVENTEAVNVIYADVVSSCGIELTLLLDCYRLKFYN